VVIGDDYWLVEPILFVAVQRMNKLVPAHAITAHWEPMRGEVGRLVRTAPMLTIVCIQIAPVDCSGRLHDTAGVPRDSRSNTIKHEGSLDSGGSYLVVSSALRE
jgi:hypothetical protein